MLEQEQKLKEQENKAQRLWIISIAGALLTALLLSLILYRNNKTHYLPKNWFLYCIYITIVYLCKIEVLNLKWLFASCYFEELKHFKVCVRWR